MMTPRVLVLGGYGVFGSRIVRSLARHPQLQVIIAGRNLGSAQRLAYSLAESGAAANAGEGAPAPQALQLDLDDPAQLEAALAAQPAVLVDAVGPFQGRSAELAQRCIIAGVHYVDIADDRERVAGIASLDAQARARDVLVVSGASTVPAISTAFVDDLTPPGFHVTAIDVGISPGHRAPRGLATVRAILGYSGRRIPSVLGTAPEYGWGGLSRHRFAAPVGARWLSHVDTPERALWAQRYPQLQRAGVKAGLELSILHLGLALLSRGVRARLLPRLDRWSVPMLAIADALDRFGTDVGAMHVGVTLRDASGQACSRSATIIAEHGDGPQIPATPAALVVKKLLGLPGYAPLALRGARPCIGMLTRAEIMDEMQGYAIRYLATESTPS